MTTTTPEATPHILDQLVWNALTTRQAHLGLGDQSARRFHPEVGPFAAVAEATPASLRALAELLGPDGFAVMPVVAPLPAIDSLHVEQVGVLCQMLAPGQPQDSAARDVVRLGPDDVPEMLDLTEKTRPGPFFRRTCEMGNYIGIRDNGRLIAMAGERMRVDGYVEISAVCVDETHRGQGLAGRLIDVLRRDILLRGEIPFLHVFEHNHAAITLYEKLGFTIRRRFFLYRVTRKAPATGTT